MCSVFDVGSCILRGLGEYTRRPRDAEASA